MYNAVVIIAASELKEHATTADKEVQLVMF